MNRQCLRLVAGGNRPTESTPRCVPLRVPEVKASDVELNGLHSLADPLHHELTLLNDQIAGSARFVVPGSAPDARDTVVRQASISKLFTDEDAESLLLHGGLSVMGADATEP